ncbi:phosphomannomutase [Clostridium putrefaciens]|uniref:phosphoglucomutase (alpha-D-glucose-1,6-bisphosphate-dependent) n=1 Tax=Clostridium putrefaciens TaxID=99675 RepID=A0A381J954_9CLOT|nr:phospho-sugar mutase [Clostridium putrefaciens]SUY47248.1 phosphomannomutase [Clostridium putrefaciens]
MYHYKVYEEWLSSKFIDNNTKGELISIKNNQTEIIDRFYKDLEFGTGGLRGLMGAGTNRMNLYTVGKATEGLAQYLNSTYKESSVAIAYDSRNMSKEFSEKTALTLCANGIKCYLFEYLRPTPMLSYALRQLHCNAGIVITASHNPKEYNGYKVYGEDGGQITDTKAKDIYKYINNVKVFEGVKTIKKELAIEKNLFNIIGEDIDSSYIDKVKRLSIRKDMIKENAKNLKIIYTPIHGSGNIPMRNMLKQLGYTDVHVVKKQEEPNGDFPTVEYPNPEDPKSFELAINLAYEIKPDIIFGTDPDCDRIGVVVFDKEEYKSLSGNEIGILLSNYIMQSLKESSLMPRNPIILKTIVTTDLVKKIAKDYNVEVMDVLTGFKYIGEKITEYENNKQKDFIFAFEESYGYLAGDFVRDKDAIITAMLISEMTLYYKEKGKTLYDALLEIYNRYGYYKEKLISIKLQGKEGQDKIERCIDYLRHSMKPTINNVNIIKKLDYKTGVEKDLIKIEEKIIGLPKSNVLKFILKDESWFVVRPSGTEPKIKIYISAWSYDSIDAEEKIVKLEHSIMDIVNNAMDIEH